MDTLNLEARCKLEGDTKSQIVGKIHFHIDDEVHLQLEKAEEQLQSSGESEQIVDVDRETLELETPPEIGAMSDCQIRVYLSPRDQRGYFHLIGHKASDGSLVYTNAVMVDQIG